MPEVKELIYTGTRDHELIAATLRELLDGIRNKWITTDTPHSFFNAYEFEGTSMKAKGEDCYFLKTNLPDLAMMSGKAAFKNAERGTSGRICMKFVKVDGQPKMVSMQAWVWNHEDKAYALDKGFFKRAYAP